MTISGTGAMTNYRDYDYVPWFSRYKKSLKRVVIENGVTTIGDYAFYKISNLSSISIPEGVTYIGKYSFLDIDSLTNISLPNSLQTIEEYAFDYTRITKFFIPANVKKIGEAAFHWGRYITEFIVDENNNYYCNDDFGCLYNKDKTEIISFSKGSSYTSYIIPSSVTTIGSCAFEMAYSLRSITIPSSIRTIKKLAFQGITLDDITIPYGVKTIGDSAFNGIKVKSIIFPDSITSFGEYVCSYAKIESVKLPKKIKKIPWWMFNECTNLKSIFIPSTCTTIESSAFSNCSNLSDVFYGGTETQWANISIDGYNATNYNGYLKFATKHYSFSETNNEHLFIIPNGLTSDGTENHIATGETYQLKAFHYPSVLNVSTTATWSSSDPGIVSVDNKGQITGKQKGIAYISATDANGITTTKSYKIYVGDAITEEEYVIKHTTFASVTTMPESFGFYNKVWNEENGRRLGWVKTWEVVGDLGEVMTFKFDDLEITADFYELFLSDIILKLAEQRAPEFKLKAIDLFQEYHGKIKKALKSTAEWEESVVDGSTVDLEIDSILLDPDFECSGNTAKVFSKVLGDFYQNHQDTFTEIFAGLDNAAAICEAITGVADIGTAFAEAYKAYTVTMVYKQVSNEFFTILYQAAERMENRQYANWFKRALNQYFELATNGDALFEASLHLCKDMTYMAFDLVAKDVVKNLTYQTVANLLGCTAGPVAIATFTYSFVYGLMDKICGLDKRTIAYEIMNYIAPVEQALCTLEDDYANILIGSQTLESAQNYDYFYNLYKQVNLYLYQAAYDFRSAAWPSKDKKLELEIFTMCMDQWKKSSCHTGLSTSIARKYSAVFCPVDVYAFNANGEKVLEIVNDEILFCNESITALTFDGKKSVIYPADQNYTIQIAAREDGEMSYYVSEITGDTSVRQVEFYDIPLTENETFSGAIPGAFDVEAEAYALTADTEIINYDYDSNDSACTDAHSVSDWTETTAATCAEPGEKEGVCSACGKRIYETLPLRETHGETRLENAVEATCKTDGYTGDEICTVCGETVSVGRIIPKETAAHRWNDGTMTTPATCTAAGEKTFTCTVCGAEKTEPTAKTAHPDADNDGWCDACKAELYSHTQTDDSNEKCRYCDTVHPNTFIGRITKFFHSVLYFFAHLFGKM